MVYVTFEVIGLKVHVLTSCLGDIYIYISGLPLVSVLRGSVGLPDISFRGSLRQF